MGSEGRFLSRGMKSGNHQLRQVILINRDKCGGREARKEAVAKPEREGGA